MTLPGDQLGAYELLRPLGAGGMAETFVAIRRGPAGFEQRVCLKRILPGCAADPLFVELVLDEARLLARLQCANIVHVYDFGEVAGTYYMALELIDGVDLEGLLSSLRERGERIPESVALYIVTEILVALSYAHNLEIDGEPQGIVHRDISPSNILLSKTGEVKLTDFGIAKSRGRSHRTQAGHTKGKIAYMSPEQMRAEELDGRSDLFAVGVVLFELLTGAHPFEASSDYALQVNIMTGKRRPLRELLPGASERLARLVDALLATDRADRPATAADALELIPPLESPFSLQRGLEALVKQRIGVKGSAASTGRASRPASASSASGHSDTALAGSSPSPAQAVAARGTTVGAPGRRGMKPLLWLAAALLLLGLGLALALGRRSELAQDLPRPPTRGGQPTSPGQAPPAIPESPSHAALPREPAAAPDAPAAVTPTPSLGDAVEARGVQAPSVPAAGWHATRHAHRHGDRTRVEADEPSAGSEPTAAPGAKEPEPASSTAVRNVAPAPSTNTQVPSLAAPPTSAAPGPALAPRDEGRPVSPRATYVTPSGRVVIAAPPL